jgi:hypothetical protein
MVRINRRFCVHHLSKHELHQDLISGIFGSCWTSLDSLCVFQILLMFSKTSQELRNVGDVVGIHTDDKM